MDEGSIIKIDIGLDPGLISKKVSSCRRYFDVQEGDGSAWGSAIQADVSLSLIPSHSARKLLLNGYIHHAPGGHMPQDSKKTSGSEDNALINEIIRRSEFSELEFLETISSTIKLVNDDFNNIKVGGLNRAFLSTLEAGFMPDPRLFKRLLDANCFAYVTLPNNIEDSRCATSSLYAMGETTYGLGQNNIKALALLRSQAYDIDSRIHYDVLCASIKAQDILGSVQVTKASDDSRMVDFLFHQWVNHENALKICSKLIDATVQAPVVAIPQSAHYHIIASLLYIYQSGVHKGHMGRDILALAASLHIKMAPHISDPRLNSIHMLMSALSQEGCLDDLLKISSDLDSRTNWGESCRPNQYTFGILANGLARYGKITDIINITENMVKRGIPVTTQYYAVLIKAFMNCDGSDPHTNTSMGRSQDIKTLHADPTSPTSNLHGHARLPVRKPRPSPESIKAAEAIFFDMKANGFECNEYIYSAMIYGFACAGNSKKAQFYFDNIFEEQKKPGSTIQLNEVIWGSLMYAYVRSRDLKGVLQVWNNAKNWKARQISDANDLKGETQRHSPSFESNHLLNMVMLCLLNLGKPKEALQLFLRSDSSSKSTIANTDRKSQKSHISLAQSLSDPYTLSMVIRAYLQHNEFNKAIEIYKGHRIPWSVRRKKRYDPIKVLSIFARDCIRSDDPNRADPITQVWSAALNIFKQ
ncbi:hypothetical protein H4219_001003 [Mycoemilia scoparia]|uniref:Pentatricopeptide repeat-containing protein n=1 Tax=Mycoemilia scoparia TaxID=417184 RepID=A0A9W8A9F0_9FUNG|nr:hypothetical protein H4219_001003 [Mycoemilia scoparia]